MELAIFNTNNSNVSAKEEIKVLWTSVLISEIIYYHGAYASVAALQDIYENYKSEEDKVQMSLLLFPTMYSNFNLNVVDYTNSVKEFYENLKKLRKRKGKNKNQVLNLLACERQLKEIFRNVSSFIYNYRCNLNLDNLSPCFGFHDNRFIKCYHEYSLSFSFDSEKYLKDVRDLFVEPYKFLISNSIVEDCALTDEGSEPIFLAMKIIDIPDFEELTPVQYLQFRKSFIPAHLDFSAFLYSVKSITYKSEFSKDNLFNAFRLIAKFTDKYKDSYQEKLNDDISKFTDISEDAKRITLFLGITSIENLIEIYHRAKLFGDDFYMYLREYLGNEIDLKRLIPFFYLKDKEEENE